MKGKMIVIAPDGTVTETAVGYAPPLRDLQAAVGGTIQLVPYFDTYATQSRSTVPCVAFCNDEGKLHGLPFNKKASDLWADACFMHSGSREMLDVLVGSIVVITGDGDLLDSL